MPKIHQKESIVMSLLIYSYFYEIDKHTGSGKMNRNILEKALGAISPGSGLELRKNDWIRP
jgi:hypothetical protein